MKGDHRSRRARCGIDDLARFPSVQGERRSTAPTHLKLYDDKKIRRCVNDDTRNNNQRKSGHAEQVRKPSSFCGFLFQNLAFQSCPLGRSFRRDNLGGQKPCKQGNASKVIFLMAERNSQKSHLGEWWNENRALSTSTPPRADGQRGLRCEINVDWSDMLVNLVQRSLTR